jgi:hypothetical protein
MHPENAAPSFNEFLRFVARRYRPSLRGSTPPEQVLAAAQAARKELRAPGPGDSPAHGVSPLGKDCEVLELLAASSQNTARPSELVTVRGFRVRLDYRDGTDTEPSSICVQVQCPEQWVDYVQGRIAYLWSGTERFELGEFDADGKAIGTLPASIEMTLTDLATGRVRLEAPDLPAHD